MDRCIASILAFALATAPVLGAAEGETVDATALESQVAGKDRLAKEEAKHLKRQAQIDRLAEIADEQGNTQLQTTVARLREKEAERHQRALDRIGSGKGRSERAGQGQGKPEGKGKPADAGGKPEGKGRPADAGGKPEGKGRPADAGGKPEGKGKPADAGGKPEGKGKPADAGGKPEGKGRPAAPAGTGE